MATGQGHVILMFPDEHRLYRRWFTHEQMYQTKATNVSIPAMTQATLNITKQQHMCITPAGLLSSAPPPLVLSTAWANSSPAVASHYESGVYKT
jgi:hypothetical protein